MKLRIFLFIKESRIRSNNTPKLHRRRFHRDFPTVIHLILSKLSQTALLIVLSVVKYVKRILFKLFVRTYLSLYLMTLKPDAFQAIIEKVKTGKCAKLIVRV